MGHPICDMRYTPLNFPQQKKSVFTLITLITERIAQFGALLSLRDVSRSTQMMPQLARQSANPLPKYSGCMLSGQEAAIWSPRLSILGKTVQKATIGRFSASNSKK